jgi:NADH dehydrogenase
VRSVIRAGEDRVQVVMDKVTKIDPERQTVTLNSSKSISYDVLLLAAGATHSYFGRDEWEEFAPGLKTLEHATEIRRRILQSFETAESTDDMELRRALLTFVVVGGGPTGVELAGSIAEISRQTLAKDFNRIDPSSTRIILIEAGKRILPSLSETLSKRATRDLEKLGVTVWTSMRVTDISADGVCLGQEQVRAKTVLWAAGVRPSPLAAMLGVETDRLGRVFVDENLRARGRANIFAIGDNAHFVDPKYGALPGLAPVAMQQGRRAADNICAMLAGKSLMPFRYIDKGEMATIGRRKAVGAFKGVEFTGVIAWLVWMIVHIYYLIGFRNKIFVFLQWISSYVFFKRGARIITSRNWRGE